MKKIKKITAALFLTLSLGATPLLTYAEELSAAAPSIESSTMSIISPYKDDIRWVYKFSNGKIYRRLFNYSTGQWVGDWEVAP